MVPADRHAPLPDPETVGDDQVAGVGPDREQHTGRGRIVEIECLVLDPFVQPVMGNHVVEGDRGQLNDIDLHPSFIEGGQLAVRLLAFHREQADLTLQGVPLLDRAPGHRLVVPYDVGQIKRDLLAGLVADDIGDLLDFDRRRLEELGEPTLAGDADADLLIEGVVPLQQLLHRLGDQLFRVRFRLTQNLGVFDVVEGIGNGLTVDEGTAERLER